MSLKQNNLAEATTELGFPAETNIPLQQEVTLEDGTKTMINGITPAMLATKLGITFKTPGEPYINGDVELNGVVQIYNGDSPEQKFDTITLGSSYKFKLKERLDTIDNMSIEELAEFLNIQDNSVFIGIGNIDNGIGIVTSYINEMPFIGISFYKDSERYGLMYITQNMAQASGFEKAGWYSVSQTGQYEPASIDEFVLEEINAIQNNLSSGTPTSLLEYDSEKLDWLLDSAESI